MDSSISALFGVTREQNEVFPTFKLITPSDPSNLSLFPLTATFTSLVVSLKKSRTHLRSFASIVSMLEVLTPIIDALSPISLKMKTFQYGITY